MGGGRVSQSASKWDALQPMSSEHELQSIITEPYDRWNQLLCVLNRSLPPSLPALFRLFFLSFASEMSQINSEFIQYFTFQDFMNFPQLW